MNNTELIAECREFDTSLYRDVAHANAGMTAKLQEAADALEAQALKIAELEKTGNEWYEAHDKKRTQVAAQAKQIEAPQADAPLSKEDAAKVLEALKSCGVYSSGITFTDLQKVGEALTIMQEFVSKFVGVEK